MIMARILIFFSLGMAILTTGIALSNRLTIGKQASQAAKALLYGKVVGIDPVDTDKYGRTVAIVRLADGATIQDRLVESGAAWVFDHFCRKPVCMQWKHKEKTARQAQKGLWGDDKPTPPRQWRAGHK